MGSEWPEYSIDELKAPIKGSIAMGPFGSRIKAENFVGEGIPIIKGAQLHGANVLDAKFDFLTEEKAEELKSSQAFRGDLVITHRGTIGQVSIIPENSKYEKYIVSQSQLKVSLDKTKVNPQFVNYFFRTHIGQHRLLENSSQVGVPAIAKASTSVKKVRVPCPSIQVQNRVVEVIGSLDDKIELNRQMNATLESMAQALFKSWFVDFDPVIDNAIKAGNEIPDAFAVRAELRRSTKQLTSPKNSDITELSVSKNETASSLKTGGVDSNNEINPLFPREFEYTEEMGWIPKGWGVVKLNELINVKYGKDHKKLNDGIIPVYGSGGVMRFVDQSLYIGESVLIPRKGTLSNLMYVDEEFWSVDTMFYSVPKSEFIMKYVFYYLKTFDFVSMNVGSAVPSMTTKVLNDINSLKPSNELLERFDNLISVYLNKKHSLEKHNQVLTKLRDTLLPKLISGELRIPEAGKLIKESV